MSGEYPVRFVRFLLAGAGLFLGLTSPCKADLRASVGWWQDPQVIETLVLMPEQSRRIEELIRQSRATREERKKRIRELRRSIPRLLNAPELDEKEVLSTLAALGALVNRQKQDLVAMRMYVRRVLSSEQFKKLLALNPNIMRQRWLPSNRLRVKRKKPALASRNAEEGR